MNRRSFALPGIVALACALAALPIHAHAGIDQDEALAFVAGAVVGHVLSGHQSRSVHWRHHGKPVEKRFHKHHRTPHYTFHRRIERGHSRHQLQHRHRHYDRHDHRYRDRGRNYHDNRKHHRGRGWN